MRRRNACAFFIYKSQNRKSQYLYRKRKNKIAFFRTIFYNQINECEKRALNIVINKKRGENYGELINHERSTFTFLSAIC